MNEIEYYRLILNKKNSKLYINDEHEYMMKEEIHITNDAYKGGMMFKNDNNYLIDVYVSNGDGSIITGSLSKKLKIIVKQ